MLYRYIVIWWLMIVALPLLAQETDDPTLNALQTVTLPENDPVDLARRLRGLNPLINLPESAPVWQIGDTQFFTVYNSSTQVEFAVNTELRGMSDNILLWIDTAAPISRGEAQQFAELVDASIYQQTQALWNTAEPAGIDGDTRLYLVMVQGLSEGIAGYFPSSNTYPRSVIPNSNQHEMMVLNLSAYPDFNILNSTWLSTIAHEYQHLLRFYHDSNEATWLDEGFSMYTEHHIGWDAGRSQVIRFLTNPAVQLNHWVADNQRVERYGAVFLFVNYLAERYGLDALRMLSDEPLDGWQGVEATLTQLGSSADEFFADWVLANSLRNADTGYGYRTLWADLPSARPLASVVHYPYEITGQVPQYSADYYVLTNFGEANSLTISYTMPETVGLIPAQAYAGDQIYYSVAGDRADTTLTRALDLSAVDSATLTFRMWYDLEENWDYGYVLASRDDGATWDILHSPYSTLNNPFGRAYGAGFTGLSFGWLQGEVALDDYAGEEILIRFEVITDPASIRHGMAIDDLRVDAIGWHDSFETPDDRWEGRGWIRTNNRLPQSAWVQAVQQVGDEVTVARWLAQPAGTWTIELVPDVEQVLIAVSPIAPQTMVETTYQLSVDTTSG